MSPYRQLTPVRLFHSVAFYPLTTMYLAAVAVVVLVARGTISVPTGVILLALVVLVLLMVSTLKELRAVRAATLRELASVHSLVNGQQTKLIARIDQLTEQLTAEGKAVPPKNPAARADP